MRSRLAALALLCAVPGVGAQLAAQCGTTVSFPVSGATWTLQGSPYCVTGNVQISGLTIQPGVEVRIAPGGSLTVVTWLRALGTREQPIVFTKQDPASGRWAGIEFGGPVPPGSPSELRHCVVTGANNSGVRILDNDQVTLVGCRIHDNTSPLDGGGVAVVLGSGTAAMFDCDIENNRATRHGGGVSAVTTNGAVLALTGCRVRANVANPNNGPGSFEGAGIRSAGNMVLLGCLIENNSVTTQTCGGSIAARGGGVHCSNGDVLVRNSVLLNNLCSTYTVPSTCGGQIGVAEGGGLFAAATVGIMQIENCFLCNNTAGAGGQASVRRGSGMQTAAGATNWTNCTIAHNSFEGLNVAGGNATVTNSIVYYNGTSIVGTATVTWSDVQGGYAGTGNIPFAPAFVGPGLVADDYNLFPTSPCIDAGDPAASSNDGCRPAAQGGVRNDIGALGGPGNCDFGGPSIVTCGAQIYGSLQQGQGAMTLDWTFTTNLPPFPGVLHGANGPASSPAFLVLGFQPAGVAVGDVQLLVDPAGASLIPLLLSGAGSFALGLDLQLPFLVGVPVFVQTVALPGSGDNVASNGLRIATCR